MKTYFAFLFLLGIFLPGFSQSKDEQQIKEVIVSESRYFAEGNYDLWSSYWVQSPQTQFIYADSKGYGKLQGWQNISATVKTIMDTVVKKSTAGNIFLERDDFQFVIEGKLALVSFRQRDNFMGMQEKIESRVMKKVGNKWKILSIYLIKTHTYKAN